MRKEQGRERQKERKADARRSGREYKAALLKLLDRFLTRPDDRA